MGGVRKKKKQTDKVSYLDMGQWPVYVGFTTSESAFKKELKRLGAGNTEFVKDDFADASTHFLHSDKGNHAAIIALKEKNDWVLDQVAALVAHEATHVAQWVFDCIGEDKAGKETEAYLIQYVTQHCLGCLKPFRSKA